MVSDEYISPEPNDADENRPRTQSIDLERRPLLKLIGASTIPLAAGSVSATDSAHDGYGEGAYGDGPYGGDDSDGDETDDEGDGEETDNLEVRTRSATDVAASSATLNGELKALEESVATCYFEWRSKDDTSWTRTPEQELEVTDSFDAAVTGLENDTEYEFRAVAETTTTERGAILAFGTETDSPEPVIEAVELTDRSNPQWARVKVEWAVSDTDGGLETVASRLLLAEEVFDSDTSGVSGTAATGEHDLRVRRGHGETYDVRVSVRDTDGNTATNTSQITLDR